MISHRLALACSALLIALLLVPGCAPHSAWAETPPSTDANPADARDATSDGPGARFRPLNPALMCSVTAALEPRASVCATDAGTDRPSDTNTASIRPDAAMRPSEPFAVLLAPSTCHGRRLPMSAETTYLRANDGMTVWHLCYKTPSPAHSDLPIARMRATQVQLNLATLDGTRELLHAPAPMAAQPWTVSVLVALPAGYAPLFELLSLYPDGQRLSAVSTDAMGRFPALHGELQAWKVAAEGTQTEQPPAQACYEPHGGGYDPAFFIPTNSCVHEADCPLLRYMACRPL